ncbi:MAG: hypothetical protein AAF609_11845 [Cyanobacteria bacterium P01_C01_bin.120]
MATVFLPAMVKAMPDSSAFQGVLNLAIVGGTVNPNSFFALNFGSSSAENESGR